MEKYFEINEQGHNIRCKLYYNDLSSIKKAVIFNTGFAGHKDNNASKVFSEKLLSKHRDVMVLVFNWPAHGDDVKKKLNLEDCSTYLKLVINELRTRYSIDQLYSYATSFGGYLILKYISEHGNPFGKIALRCPAIDMYAVLTNTIMQQDEYDRILKGKETQVGFSRKIVVSKSLLEDLKANDIQERKYLDYAENMLILHGTKDEVVPYNDSLTFAEQNLIEFVTVENADHRFQNPAHMSLANKLVMEFFDL